MAPENKLLEFAKFYTNLKRIELEIRDLTDLGHHLDIQPELLNSLNETAQLMKNHLKEQSNIFKKNESYDIK